MMEDFGDFGTKNQDKYLGVRSRIRRALEWNEKGKRPVPHSEEEIAVAAEKAGPHEFSG